jgi:hypothetical protein
MEFTLKYGLFGLRRVKLRFDLAALKAATIAARMDLGEFFTSDKLNENERLFFHTYGAWLCGGSINENNLRKFSKIWQNFKLNQVNKIKEFQSQSEITSKELLKSIKKATSDDKTPVTWAGLHDIILGELQMSIQQAMKMTFNEIIIMQLGKTRQYEKQMHGIRLIMWEIRTKYLKKGKIIQPSDIFKLSSDIEVKPERMTKEKFQELIKKGGLN